MLEAIGPAASAREAGAGCVMVTGSGPLDRGRPSLALEFGADLAADL